MRHLCNGQDPETPLAIRRPIQAQRFRLALAAGDSARTGGSVGNQEGLPSRSNRFSDLEIWDLAQNYPSEEARRLSLLAEICRRHGLLNLAFYDVPTNKNVETSFGTGRILRSCLNEQILEIVAGSLVDSAGDRLEALYRTVQELEYRRRAIHRKNAEHPRRSRAERRRQILALYQEERARLRGSGKAKNLAAFRLVCSKTNTPARTLRSWLCAESKNGS